ncbi:hypothetical protein KUCAC02_036435 [Chaenocephalus aceratus]|nr:hypothetical protein KUCAC02_036435 [Chaenocephalus aceratus]
MQQETMHHPAAQRLREVPDYNYFCRETDERLPKRGTDPFSKECSMKRQRERERSSLQQAAVDVRPHVLPTLSRAGDARHGSKDAESSTADLRPTRTPTIKTPGAPAGRHSALTGVESSKNRGKETGERSPRLDTSKSRDTKQENSEISLRRTLVAPPLKKNSETRVQRTLVTPPLKKNSENSLRRTLVTPPLKKNSEISLRRTLVTQPLKKNSETSLRRTLVTPPLKKNNETRVQRTLVAPPLKKNSETSLRRTLVAPPLKKNSETRVQRTLVTPPLKKNSEISLRRTLVTPPLKKNSETSLRRTLVAPLTIANPPAVKIRSARVGSQTHSLMTGEPLRTYSTPQTQMIKRKQENSMVLN